MKFIKVEVEISEARIKDLQKFSSGRTIPIMHKDKLQQMGLLDKDFRTSTLADQILHKIPKIN